MTEPHSDSCDVLIIGASMAGGCLARQLSLELPELSVIVVDERESFEYGVGESTVEQFDDYVTRVLRLGPYMARRHVVKHGLRFWFDSPQHDLSIVEMSELGRAHYPDSDRGFQIDRSAFDQDLVDINRANGVDVRLGVDVVRKTHDEGHLPGIEIDAANGHIVRTKHGEFRCRYLIDAAGWGSPIVRELDLLDTDHSPAAKGALWGRFRVRRTIDDSGDDAWRARVDHTLRWASTNHFMYDGYWIWLIGLTEGLVSVGVTYDRDVHSLELHGRSEFEAFLRSHRAVDEVLGDGAELVDYHRMPHVVRGSKQFFSTDRWFLTGVAGLFIDPLYSTSCIYIAMINRLIVSAIEADLAGDERRFAARIKHFDLLLRSIFLRQTVTFADYHMLGSFDVFWNWHTQHYQSLLNYDARLQHEDYRSVIAHADEHGPDCDCDETRATDSQRFALAADRLRAEFLACIDEHAAYHSHNRGFFAENTERELTRTRVNLAPTPASLLEESRVNWEAYVRFYVARMCELKGVRFSEARFRAAFEADWERGQSLATIVDALEEHGPGDTDDEAAVWWSAKGPISPELVEQREWWCRFLGPDGSLLPEHLRRPL